MDKLRKAIWGKDRRKDLNDFILLIEENKDSNPNVALDALKTTIETIAKTILADKWISFADDSKLSYLVKTCLSSLPFFTKLANIDQNRAKSIINSLENIWNQIGWFRNSYGFFSHGQDLESARFDHYLLELAIDSADLLSSFLIISHAEDLKDRSRLYYEEHHEFNQYIDDSSIECVVWKDITTGVRIVASQALFTDPDAYQDNLLSFKNDKQKVLNILINATTQEEVLSFLEQIVEYKDYLTVDEIDQIFYTITQSNASHWMLEDKNISEFLTTLHEDNKSWLHPILKEKAQKWFNAYSKHEIGKHIGIQKEVKEKQ